MASQCMIDTVISLTTIPPRMERIFPTLESLLNQSAKIDRIILNIPAKYRRFEFLDFQIPKYPDGIEVNICETDYGPATKLLPTLIEYRNRDAKIIYCDDDRVYEPGWADWLVENSEIEPNTCVADSGSLIQQIEIYHSTIGKKIGVIGDLMNTIKYKIGKPKTPRAGIVDIAAGFGGVLVRPSFFDQEIFEIPDVIWTVDDIWISGHLARKNVQIRKISDKPKSTLTELGNVSALMDFVFKSHTRNEADMAGIAYFRQKYGIWND